MIAVVGPGDATTDPVVLEAAESVGALLAEAGHPDRLKFDLYTAEGVPGMVRMAQVYAEMAKPAGIDVNVIVTPADSFWDNVWLKKSIVTSAWPRPGIGTLRSSLRPEGCNALTDSLSLRSSPATDFREIPLQKVDYCYCV